MRFAGRFGVPIMLDESLCSRVDAERAIADGTCDLFNLRLSKCGGFIPTLRLAQFATQHRTRLPTRLPGGRDGDPVGGRPALRHQRRRSCATSKAPMIATWSREALATRDITFGWGGWARALPAPGLGITVDPAALERVAVNKVRLL